MSISEDVECLEWEIKKLDGMIYDFLYEVILDEHSCCGKKIVTKDIDKLVEQINLLESRYRTYTGDY